MKINNQAFYIIILLSAIVLYLIYRSYVIQTFFLIYHLTQIIHNPKQWHEISDEKLGIKLSVPLSWEPRVYKDIFSLNPYQIAISDMSLDTYLEPNDSEAIYIPEIGGVGGGYENSEKAIYKGIVFTIDRNVIDREVGKNRRYESVFTKYCYSGKDVFENIVIGNRTYQIRSSYLNIPEYDTLYQKVIKSIRPL